ncbi:MAG: Mur ligase family protein [Peptoniphilus sp.]|nr:Mur ligase family protein [Peptoniphilus sp.]MDD7363343.1 Mur ligase family protein [Bacillota bacterium]MDY6044262.1 Mur ligase family protein [Peptoniphilus sp.]
MKLQKLLEVIEYSEIKGDIDPDAEIEHISNDSRDIHSGDIFVAMKGVLQDGHDYVEKARESGASLAVVDHIVDSDIAQVVVENPRMALADLACEFYGHPSREMTVLGVTATNGKTSTAYMIRDIFKAAGYEVGVVGTVEVQYKDVSIPSILTTPESIHLQRHLRNMADSGIDVVVMEVSSSAQELYRNRGIDYDIVSFNNISVEHLEQHGTFENYFHFKSRLIRHAEHKTAVVLNIDAPLIKGLVDQTEGQVFTAGIEEEALIGIRDIDISSGFPTFNYVVTEDRTTDDWSLKKTEFSIDLQVAGYHSVLNAMIAITFGLLAGIDESVIRGALHEFKGVERRFELIYNKDYMIIDDHYANVKNIDVTLETLCRMDYDRLHILYAIRGGRGAELNRENAEETVKWMPKLPLENFIATKSVEVVSSKDAVTDGELEAFQREMQKAGYDIPVIDNLKEAIDRIQSKVEPGDVLLLAGCQGMDHGAKYIWQALADQSEGDEKMYWQKKIDERIC